ncbi:MAG: hypothetical protein ABIN58_10035, partial [candidate division WOR-3 bacterium]
MSENIVKTVSDLLNEEKWTRATLNSYTINNFVELDALIQKTISAEAQDAVLELCEEHLKHTRNSIIALYMSGIISLGKQLVDDSNLVVLINIFVDNHKWNIVEYLCNRVLEFGESKYALRMLAECYEKENKEARRTEMQRRLTATPAARAERIDMQARPAEERRRDFGEVYIGLTEEQARAEAARCLSCGICSECLQCVYACQAHAIDHTQVERIEEL